MSNSSEWVSLGTAAEIIGVHPATIRNWAERGEIPYRRTPGGHRRFRRADLQQWIASNRLAQSKEAQVVVQSALGRTRLQIGSHDALGELDWYRQLTPEARSIMRQQGLRLMDSLMQFLATPETNGELTTAHKIGEIYGDLLLNEGLALSEAVEGYFYFSDFLFETVLQLSETDSSSGQAGWGEIFRQVNRYTRAILSSMIAQFERK